MHHFFDIVKEANLSDYMNVLLSHTSHTNDFVKVVNGDDALSLPHFGKINFQKIHETTHNTVPSDQNNHSKSFGYAQRGFERERHFVTKNFAPMLKGNTVGNKDVGELFIETSSLLVEVDKNKQFYFASTPKVIARNLEAAHRILLATGLPPYQCRCNDAEGLTTGINRDPEREEILVPMPVCGHFDRFNCPDAGTNFLLVASTTIKNEHGGKDRVFVILYDRKTWFDYYRRTRISMKMENDMVSYFGGLPSSLKDQLKRIMELERAWACGRKDLFHLPAHMDKCMFHLIFTHCQESVAAKHNALLYRRIELLAITVLCNGGEKLWGVTTSRWATFDSLPRENLVIQYMKDCGQMFGYVQSNSPYCRHQPSSNFPITRVDILRGCRVLLEVVHGCNSGLLDFDGALSAIKSGVHGARDLVGMHLISQMVLFGLIVNRTFLIQATLALSSRKKVSRYICQCVVLPKSL